MGHLKCATQEHFQFIGSVHLIQISEQLHLWVPGEYKDDVLFKLICMDVFNWDRDDHRTNALMQVMHHSTAMVHRVLERIKHNETTVSCLLS